MKFEYTVFYRKPGDSALDRTLNDYGTDGWECFAVTDNEYGMTFYFKRAKQ
jgi:hypothetical protein